MEILTRYENGLIRVMLTGDLDISNVVDATREIKKVLRRRHRVLVLDLSGLSFIDSAGMRLILQAEIWTKQNRRRFGLVKGPENVHRAFRVAGIDKRLEFVDSVFPAPELQVEMPEIHVQ